MPQNTDEPEDVQWVFNSYSKSKEGKKIFLYQELFVREPIFIFFILIHVAK